MKSKATKGFTDEKPPGVENVDAVGAVPASAPGPLASVHAALGRLGGFAVLGIIVVTGTALLFGMRELGMAGGVELIEIKIDYPLDEKDRAPGPDHRTILEDLRTSGELRQVPPELVQMNPFEWKEDSATEQVVDNSAATEAERKRREAQARETQLKSALAQLKLNSVMGGRVPMAQISGQLVRVGDVVGQAFMVTKIEGRTVALVIDGREFVLALGE